MSESLSLHDVEQAPKLDLHLHLDGAISGDTIMSVAESGGIEIPGITEQTIESLQSVYPDAGPFHAEKPEEFDRFLALFGKAIAVMGSPETIEATTLRTLNEMQQQNIVYAELRFAPSYHVPHGQSPKEMKDSMRDIINGVLRAMANGRTLWGLQTKLIICIPREIAYIDNYEGPSPMGIVETALEFQDDGVVALDLACSEHFGPEEYVDAFRETIGTRLKRTVHAGETGLHMRMNLLTAVNDMGADRIGHGRPIPNLPYLMEEIRKSGIGVERCPISNQIMCCTDGDFDRLNVLINEGVLVSVNSDDPGVFGPSCSLDQNLFAVAQRYKLGMNGIKLLTANAVQSAFCSGDEKRAVIEKLEAFYGPMSITG